MKICGIYKITSPNNKVYIGQSVDIEKRWNVYKTYHCKLQTYLYNSLKKYGWEKHKFDVLCQCDSSELNNLELYYIELYQSFNSKNGLNLRSGGGQGNICSEETKNKIRLKKINIPLSEEHKNNLKKSRALQIMNPRSEETKLKISKANKGKTLSEEHKIKISEAHKGCRVWNKGLKGVTKMSDETKKKMSESGGNRKGVKLSQKTKDLISKANKGKLIGIKNPFYGKHHSKETKQKIRDSKQKNRNGNN